MHLSSSNRWNLSGRGSKTHQTRPSQFSYENEIAFGARINVCRPTLTCSHQTSTKTPFVHNGNNTFKLTHTRYSVSPNSSTNRSLTPSSVPKVVTSTQAAGILPKEPGIAPSTDETENSLPAKIAGFRRDQTIGDQVRQAIGKEQWDKKVNFRPF